MAPKGKRVVAVVLVDVNRCLGHPFCSQAALVAAISEEVIQETERAEARAPWRMLASSLGGAAKRKEDIRARVAATSRSVLSGDRAPPPGVERLVDAAARELASLAEAQGATIMCQLFDSHAGTVAAVMPALFGGVPPERLPAAWDSPGGGASIPNLAQICAAGFRGATVVLVLAGGALQPQPIAEQLLEGADALPILSAMSCGASPPPGFAELSELCPHRGGLALTTLEPETFRNSLWKSMGLESPRVDAAVAAEAYLLGTDRPHAAAAEADLFGLQDMDESVATGQALATGKSDEVVQQFPAVETASGPIESFDAAWHAAGPLGLDFGQDWVVASSFRPEIRPGDVLLFAGEVPTTGSSAAPYAAVADVLRSRRPLVLTFTRPAGAAEPRPFRPPERAPPAPLSADEVAVVENVIREHAAELEVMAPLARRARIRDLVAAEMRKRAAVAGAALALRGPTKTIHRALNANRDGDQRVLLEWLFVLCRTFSFCGDAVSLARGSLCCKQWRAALRPDGSTLARCLWKWSVRFGEPVPDRCRWAFWRWLLQAGPALSHASTGRAVREAGRRLTGRASGDHFREQAMRGRADASMADVRGAIAADLSAAEEADADGPAAGEGSIFANPDARRRALERILVAVAVECPSVGYREGLDFVASFVLSVAEEAGGGADTVAAGAFAFMLSVLELDGTVSCLAPRRDDTPRAASPAEGALGLLLLERQPALARHLAAEDGAAELQAMPGLRALFTGPSPLPRAVLCRAWDCWLLDGNAKIFFRTALSLLERASSRLLREAPGAAVTSLRYLPACFGEPGFGGQGAPASELFSQVWDIKVTHSSLRRMLNLEAPRQPLSSTALVQADGAAAACVAAQEEADDAELLEENHGACGRGGVAGAEHSHDGVEEEGEELD